MSYPEFLAWLREEWPHPPDHVLARLRHTLEVYDSPLLDAPPANDDIVVSATGGVYQDEHGNMVQTGLTWGDLRAIRDVLVRLWEIDGERVMAPILNIPPHNFGPGQRPTIGGKRP